MTIQSIPIRFRCPHCSTRIKAPESAAGKNGTCPKCGSRLAIPASNPLDEETTGSRRQNSMVMTIAGVAFEDIDTPDPKPRARDPYVGVTLGADFEIEGFIGAGGIARVYKGKQRSLERTVAVKILAGPAMTRQRLARFRREAVTVGRLSHPNILQVFAFGAEESLCWMAMEYIDGGDVYSRLGKGLVPWTQALMWFKQTLAGLQAAHDAGIVHRDLKPQNLMLTSQSVIRIADFGLVKVADDQAFLTGDGKTVGTPAYIAPEQAMGEEVDTRADIYSLGATFYHVFGGQAPFRASSSTAILLKHVQENPVPLSQVRPELPWPLVNIISRMMEKTRERRYQSASVILAELDSYDRFGGLQSPKDNDSAAVAAHIVGPTGRSESVIDPSGSGHNPVTSSSQSGHSAIPSPSQSGITSTSTDSKTCPFCGETIKMSAVKCRFCGETLPATPAAKRTV